MLGLYVTVPIACFRPGAAREFWETLPLPPPSTVYGFLLSMVGETDRTRHLGVRCTAGVIGQPDRSTVLRRMWRIKEFDPQKGKTPGNGANVRPDYQQLLTNVRIVMFVDSAEERNDDPTLEQRIMQSLNPLTRNRIERFGGLSLGESTYMVDEVCLLEKVTDQKTNEARLFLLADDGRMTLPVWVDHVGAAGTRFQTGSLTTLGENFPSRDRVPQIDDGNLSPLATTN